MINEKVLIGLSGGINSMAVLCWLAEQKEKPKEVHLFYAHFYEHSPDTFQFVADGIRFARKHFDVVKVKITKNSILAYFRHIKMILHPARGLCSFVLKIEPASVYAFENDIKIDLIGYVKHELKRRMEKQQANLQLTLFGLEKHYPIGEFSDAWCFDIVKKYIGWWPAIYDIVDEDGNRVFKHNNCLPCKNAYPEDIEAVRKHFPEYYRMAMQLSAELGKFWGRDKDDFYMRFGRDLGQETTCETCTF